MYRRNSKKRFLYIDDLINLIFKIFDNKKLNGQIINAGSGKSISVKRLIELIKKSQKEVNLNMEKS